jgi:hypothetical protein
VKQRSCPPKSQPIFIYLRKLKRFFKIIFIV